MIARGLPRARRGDGRRPRAGVEAASRPRRRSAASSSCDAAAALRRRCGSRCAGGTRSQNAIVAVRLLEELGRRGCRGWPPTAIARGARRGAVAGPARPAGRRARATASCCDAAHNPAGARVLADYLREVHPGRPADRLRHHEGQGRERARSRRCCRRRRTSSLHAGAHRSRAAGRRAGRARRGGRGWRGPLEVEPDAGRGRRARVAARARACAPPARSSWSARCSRDGGRRVIFLPGFHTRCGAEILARACLFLSPRSSSRGPALRPSCIAALGARARVRPARAQPDTGFDTCKQWKIERVEQGPREADRAPSSARRATCRFFADEFESWTRHAPASSLTGNVDVLAEATPDLGRPGRLQHRDAPRHLLQRHRGSRCWRASRRRT